MDPHSSDDRRLSLLMSLAQDGDARAYEAFLQEAARLVRGIVRSRLSRAADAEDVVQDVLLAIHRHRHTYDPARPVAPWLYAIARHRVFDALKSSQRRARNELLEGAHGTGFGALDELPAAAPAVSGGVGSVAPALAVLSAAQRQIIELLKVEGYSVVEIAQITGRSPSAVKVAAHRAYKLLRAFLVGNEA